MRLFIYGTLMRGEPSHALLCGATYLGPARTAPGFALVRLGWYPGMVAEPGPTQVTGEIYQLGDDAPVLAELDTYEDVPALYERVEIPLAGAPPAVAYVLHGHHAAGLPRLPSGDWRAEQRAAQTVADKKQTEKAL